MSAAPSGVVSFRVPNAGRAFCWKRQKDYVSFRVRFRCWCCDEVAVGYSWLRSPDAVERGYDGMVSCIHWNDEADEVDAVCNSYQNLCTDGVCFSQGFIEPRRISADPTSPPAGAEPAPATTEPPPAAEFIFVTPRDLAPADWTT